MHKHLKIRLLITQMIAVIPFLIFIFYLFDLWYDSSRTQIFTDNYYSAQLTSGIVNEFLQQLPKTSSMIAMNENFLKNMGSDKINPRNYLLPYLAEDLDAESIYLFTPAGELTATTRPVKGLEDYSFSSQTFFQQAIRFKNTAISDPLTDKLSGKTIISAASPVIKNSEVLYVVLVNYNINQMKTKIEKVLPPAKSKKTILVFDTTRFLQFIADKPLPSEKEKTLFLDFPIIKQAQEGKTVLLENETLPVLNVSAIGAAASVADTGWVVVSINPVSDVFSAFWKLQSMLWLILFTSIIFAFGVISYSLSKVRIAY